MNTYNPNRLYKDERRGRIMGVCAGIADYFDVRPSMVRLLTVIAAFITGFFFTIAAYVLLGFILEAKPEEIATDPEEEKFWRKARTKPEYTKVDLRNRYEDIEHRIRKMEAYMTSKQFRLNRELRELED